jgi:hypothetical protein
MDEQQQQQDGHDPNKLGAKGPASEGQPSLSPSDGLDVPIFEHHTPQMPMNLPRDNLRDGTTTDTVSDSTRAIANSVWPCESMRDTHESIREVNGRQYNAQNTTYFLPASESPSLPTYPPLWTPNSHACAINLYILSNYA